MRQQTRRPVPPRRRTLREDWEASRDRRIGSSATHDTWCRGHGWMLDAGLAEILDPLVYEDAYGDTSIRRFTGLDAEVAERLLEPLGADYLGKERQNDGPTMGSVLRAVLAHPDEVRAHGYIVGPGRCDERLTVEGVLFRADREYLLCSTYGLRLADCECRELFGWMRGRLDLDARVSPTELDKWFSPEPEATEGPADHWYRAWWT